MRRAHHEGLIGDHHPVGRGIVHHRIDFREIAPSNNRIIRREHILRLPPRPVAFDDAGDGDVANLQGLHGQISSR